MSLFKRKKKQKVRPKLWCGHEYYGADWSHLEIFHKTSDSVPPVERCSAYGVFRRYKLTSDKQ